MKVVLLCGGFAKRLWPLTKNKPKPLLEVAGKAIIEYTLENLKKIPEISEVFISTNKKFEKVFENWLNQYRREGTHSPLYRTTHPLNYTNKLVKNQYAATLRIKLIIEETKTEEEKLGSIGGLGFLIKKENLDDDLLVIAGDNIFEFDLKEFVEFFKGKQETVNAFYDFKNLDLVKKYGVGVLDKEGKLVDFTEKSKHPKSTLVSAACYLFPKKIIPLIFEYLESENPDAMGFFIKWLLAREKIYGFRFKGKWFDIGNFEELEKAREYFKNKGGS